MDTSRVHHCPSACAGLWTPPRALLHDNCRPRHAEPAFHCAPPPCCRRQPDVYIPSGAVPDEHIPGRLTFDLYLVRSNRLARAAEWDHEHRAHRCDDHHRRPERADDARRPHDNHHQPSLAVAPQDPAARAAGISHLAQLVVLATRRGGLIDVLA